MTPLTPNAMPLDASGTTELGIYTTATAQAHGYGRQFITEFGQLFRYSKSGTKSGSGTNHACPAGVGCKFRAAISDGIDYAALGIAQAIGDSQLTFVACTHNALVKNELAGGQVLISDVDAVAAGGSADDQVQNRICIGNDASANGAAATIYLNAPTIRALTTSSYAFVMPSQWSNIAYSESTGDSVAGIAAAYVAAASYFFWLQTYGPCWISSVGNLGKTALKRGFGFRYDGRIVEYDNSVANATSQYGGYVIDNNTAANGATFVQLML
jgi:hypothetical protein